MTNKYLGEDHYFAQKFKRRKSMIGQIQETQQDYNEIEPEPDYYQTAPYNEGFPQLQVDSIFLELKYKNSWS